MPRAILGSATAVGVLVAASLLYAQQQAQFLMPMYDEKGAPVATFSPSDLGIFEDGKPAKVLKVEPKIVPMRVILATPGRAPRPYAYSTWTVRRGQRGRA